MGGRNKQATKFHSFIKEISKAIPLSQDSHMFYLYVALGCEKYHQFGFVYYKISVRSWLSCWMTFP